MSVLASIIHDRFHGGIAKRNDNLCHNPNVDMVYRIVYFCFVLLLYIGISQVSTQPRQGMLMYVLCDPKEQIRQKSSSNVSTTGWGREGGIERVEFYLPSYNRLDLFLPRESILTRTFFPFFQHFLASIEIVSQISLPLTNVSLQNAFYLKNKTYNPMSIHPAPTKGDIRSPIRLSFQKNPKTPVHIKC
jgi:hypothetical protein